LEVKTAEEAAKIAVDYAKKAFKVKGEIHLTSVGFDGSYFVVRGYYHFEGRKGVRPQLVNVKVDGEGKIVGWSLRPEKESTEL